MGEVRITLLPEGEDVTVPEGSTVKEAAFSVGIILDGPCGDRQSCGKCRVRVFERVPPPGMTEKNILTAQELASGWRLGCVVRVEEGMLVEVPPERRLEGQRMLIRGVSREVPVRPNVYKVCISSLSSEGAKSDAGWVVKEVQRAFRDVRIDYELIKSIPRLIGSGDQGLTAVVVGGELVALEKGNTTGESFGVAFDIGTTTLVATLMDLNEGEELATISALNPQTQVGEDVISRMDFCIQEEGRLEVLQGYLVEVVNQLIGHLCEQGRVNPENIYELTFVGNTVMVHLLLGISPRGLARLPFRPVFTEPFVVTAGELGINSVSKARVQAPPNIAGFVGSDTVGVILANSIHKSDRIRLAVDLGTNGEVVLGSKERLLVCSTAAGPAFEGARVEHGMRATDGAIDRVWINGGRLGFSVIGAGRPHGICGSGLVDTVAELLRVGIVDKKGTIRSASELKGKVPEPLRQRVKRGGGGNLFFISEDPEVKINQRDVRGLQLAKGAIQAGVRILIRKLQVKAKDVEEIFLCGAFGNFIAKESAVRIGLLPGDWLGKIRAMGNSAFEGAKLMLISTEDRQAAEKVARQAEHVDLSAREDFREEFMRAMLFP